MNEEFSTSEEYDCRDQVRAREQAIKSVFAIAAEQVAAGKPFFGAHVIIEGGTPPQLELVVSAGASPLTKQDEA